MALRRSLLSLRSVALRIHTWSTATPTTQTGKLVYRRVLTEEASRDFAELHETYRITFKNRFQLHKHAARFRLEFTYCTSKCLRSV